MIHPYNEILPNKKEQTMDTYNNMDESQMHVLCERSDIKKATNCMTP